MGKVGKFIAGGFLILGGIVIGAVTGQWQLGLAIASIGVGILTRPKIPNDLASAQGAILQNRVGSLNGIPVIYGTARLGPVTVDVRVDPASTNRKRLVVVMAWCHGSQDGSNINSIDKVYFDLRLAIDGSTVQTPFSTIAEGSTKHLEYAHFLGSSAQTVDTRLNTLFPAAWPTTSKGAGIAYSRFEMWFNPDIYGGGVPQVQALIKGAKVFDPRDSTVKFSNNPALCIRDYLTSTIYGLAVPVANLDDQSFIDMANYYDETVNIPGLGTGPRYTCDGVLDTNRSVVENLAKLCSSARAQVINQGNKWRLITRRQRTVSGIKLDADNTMEGSWNYVLPGSEVPNFCRATFVDPNQQYQTDTVEWPDTSQANVYLTQDGGYESRIEMDLPFTPSRARAQQLAMTTLKEARAGMAATCVLTEGAMSVQIGDLVQVTQESPGWVDKKFDVLALLLQPDSTVQAILASYDPTAYDLDTQVTPTAPPGTNLPDPFTLAPPVGLGLDGSAAQATLTGDGGRYIGRIKAVWSLPSDPFIEFVEVEAQHDYPLSQSMLSQSGLTSYIPTAVANDNLTDNAWNTDSAVSGAFLAVDLGAGVTQSFTTCKIWAVSASYAGNYNVEYSDDGSSWSVAVSGFIPSAAGINIISWAPVGAHRYWRIKLTNTPGAGSWLAELGFALDYDAWGRVAVTSDQTFFLTPTSRGVWGVRIRAVNRLAVRSTWVTGHVVVVDWPPQITTMTLSGAHVDVAHQDIAHQDGGHNDAAHSDAHSDVAHSDVAHGDVAHSDSHTDSHSDVAHGDADHDDSPALYLDAFSNCNQLSGSVICQNHGDTGHSDSAHTDSHSDVAHSDVAHSDVAHSDSHTDTHGDSAHGDAPHTDSHTDATHGDGNYGIGVAVQADADAGSIKVVARKGGSNMLINPGAELGAIGNVYQSAGYTWKVYPNNIPFSADKQYRLRVRVRRTATTDSLKQKFYCGLEGIAADGTTLVNVNGSNSHGSQHYIAAENEDASAWTVNEWREYIGYVQGAAATGNSGEFPDPTNPAKLHQNVRFIRPLFIVNFDTGPAGNVMQIDYIHLEVLDGTGTLLLETFEVTPSSWTVVAGPGTETTPSISTTQALGWGGIFGVKGGNDITAATDFFQLGGFSLKIDNTVGNDSYAGQRFYVVTGKRYRVSAWIKTNALPTADAGSGAFIDVNTVSGPTGFTIISKTTIGTDPSGTQPDCGIAADGAAHAFTHVECIFEVTGGNGTIDVLLKLGYGGNQSGIAWFDDVWFQEVYIAGATPDLTDIRSQSSVDGRNVTVALIDMLTQSMITLLPGENMVIGGLAYSRPGGIGIEGPRALARANFFPVAPVGTDQWVPS